MREKLKSLALLCLIISSIYMTGQLWLTTYAPVQQANKGSEVVPPDPLSMLAPVAATIHPGSGIGTLQFAAGTQGFSTAWEAFRDLVKGAHLVSLRTSSEAELKKAFAGDSVELKLAGRTQLRLWLEAIGSQPNYLPTEHSFDRVLISSQSPNIYFWDSVLGTYASWDNIAPKERPDLVKEQAVKVVEGLKNATSGYAMRLLDPPYRALAAQWVYIPRNPGSWPQLWARSDKNRSQQLVAGFFDDWSLVRRIPIRDGKVHYTDGSRGVYLEASGAIEYYESLWLPPRQGLDINSVASSVLSEGLSFVAKHGGWPTDARLTLMETQVRQGIPMWNFEFVPYTTIDVGTVKKYVPVVSYRTQISVGVTDRAASPALEYERYVYIPLSTGASPLPILPAETALMVAERENMLIPGVLVTDMYIAYFQRQIDQTEELLYPVWVIEQGSHKSFVHGFVQAPVKP